MAVRVASEEIASDRRWPTTFAAVLTALGMSLMASRLIFPQMLPPVVALMAASTCYLAVAALNGALRSAFGRYMFAGLVGCWLGDYFGSYLFIASVLAFLSGHVAFTLAFWNHGLERRRALYGLLVFVPVGALIYRWMAPHVPPSERLLIVAYTVVLSSMAIAAFATRNGPGRLRMLAAALLFFISDIFVARWRFVDQDGVNAFFCYPLYYTSCFVFAYTMLGRDANHASSRANGSSCSKSGR